MVTAFKFIALVITLNIIRYVYAYLPVEQLASIPMFGVMSEHSSYFKTAFSTTDWVTSYIYNFMMWLACTWVFMLVQPRLKGHIIVRSLKVYRLMFLIVASISAIYMNHYSHPKAFYFYSIFDALLVFPIVAIATGLLWPVFLKPISSPHSLSYVTKLQGDPSPSGFRSSSLALLFAVDRYTDDSSS